MARQFFDARNATALGLSFSPAQMIPIQDLASRQLPVIPTSRATPNFNGAWAETDRAPSLPLSPAAWASEFSSGAFAPGPVVQQSITPVKGARTVTQPEHKI